MNIKYKFNNDWINKLNKPIVISGPCSAESEYQMLKTAETMDKNYIHFFRAGVWKPRTKPNTFEGIGSIGLKWLQKVKKETGMMVATEVANSYHVKECLKYNIDLLWIGARSAVNPFTVQEIAESLKGTEKIILVKNPTHIDLDLWIGALERLLEQGITKIGVIHRGFSTTSKNVKYRNQPHWDLIIDLKKKYPKLPIFCDPSHISGKREVIEYILRKSIAIKYDGFMVEAHYQPNLAWSDSKQQITPKELLKLLINNNYVKRHNYYDTQDKIKILRTQIDEIDQNLLSLLSNRYKISKKIGIVKKHKNISVLQPNRWENILKKILTLSKKMDLSKKYIKKIFTIIHEESINIQNQMFNS